jgi:catechol 2,3-dioxygenase-like lactoylglutathione lyase family enzyme
MSSLAGAAAARLPDTCAAAAAAPSPPPQQPVMPPSAAFPPRRRALLAGALSAAALLAARTARASGGGAALATFGAGSPALLHAVVRVADLDATARFFVDAYSMKVLRSRPGNVFVGYGSESHGDSFSLELSQLPEGALAADAGVVGPFGGITVAVDNPTKAAAKAVAAGARRGGGRCAGDALAGCVVIGPDGVPVSFAKAGSSLRAPLARITLNVADLARTTAWYVQALGMTALPANGRQEGVSDRAVEDPPTPARTLLSFPGGRVALELRLAPPGAKLAPTPLFDKVAVGVPDLAAAAARVAACADATGGALVDAPFAVPGIGTHVAIVRDPDGHTLALVDSDDFEKELS